MHLKEFRIMPLILSKPVILSLSLHYTDKSHCPIYHYRWTFFIYACLIISALTASYMRNLPSHLRIIRHMLTIIIKFGVHTIAQIPSFSILHQNGTTSHSTLLLSDYHSLGQHFAHVSSMQIIVLHGQFSFQCYMLFFILVDLHIAVTTVCNKIEETTFLSLCLSILFLWGEGQADHLALIYTSIV